MHYACHLEELHGYAVRFLCSLLAFVCVCVCKRMCVGEDVCVCVCVCGLYACCMNEIIQMKIYFNLFLYLSSAGRRVARIDVIHIYQKICQYKSEYMASCCQ